MLGRIPSECLRTPFQTVSVFPTSERVVDGGGGLVDRRYKEGPPPPPPDIAADPEPGMIAKMRGPLPPLCEKSLICSMRLFAPRLQSTPELSRTLLIPPSWSSPAFLLPLFTQPTQKRFSTNFALTEFSEVRHFLGVLRGVYVRQGTYTPLLEE